MKASLAIAVRDFKSFFETPIGWMSACIIYLISGIVFFVIVSNLLSQGQSVNPGADIFNPIISFLNYIAIFVVPAFTMRVMSEELNQGSYRLLAGAPISTWSIVAGKFLGIAFFFGAIGFFMLIYPLYAYLFTQPDIRTLASGWLGMFLNIAAITSIGLFIGSLTKNPVLSYLGSAFSIILFIFSAFISGMPEWYKKSVNLLSLGEDFSKGVINTSTLSIFIGIVLTFLFLCRFVLESKRWRI
jgi:ABC-2 type transport system permease protein